jgi:hypothetical protein
VVQVGKECDEVVLRWKRKRSTGTISGLADMHVLSAFVLVPDMTAEAWVVDWMVEVAR